MPKEKPTVIPMISYEDGIAALDWLAKAFGFQERTRLTQPDGSLSLGEMQAGDGLIMLATPTQPMRIQSIIVRPARE